MFASYVPGVPHDWPGKRLIIHYTSADLWDWHFEADGSHIYQADSIDLYNWQVAGAVLTDHAQKGPNVFFYFTHPQRGPTLAQQANGV